MIYIHLLGLLGFVFLGLSYTMKKKESVLICQVICFSLYSIYFEKLGASSGHILSAINLLRCLYLAIWEKNSKKQNDALLVTLLVIYILSVYFSYQDIFSFLPGIGAITSSALLWKGNIKQIRIGGAINSISWVLYDIHVGAYVCIATDSIVFIINVLFLLGMIKNGKQGQNKGKVKTITE